MTEVFIHIQDNEHIEKWLSKVNVSEKKGLMSTVKGP